MRARHRLSKLLLRHGVVYDARAWTLAQDAWLRRRRFPSGPLALAFDECYGAMLQAKTRRDALDRAIGEIAVEPPFAAVVGRLVCLRGVSTLTALALTVELGDWQRFRPSRSARSSASCRARTRPASGAGWARSPRPATPTLAGCRSRPPGTSVDRCAPAHHSSGAARASPLRSARRQTKAHAGCTNAGTHSRAAASVARSSRSPSRASSPATAGRWRRWSSPPASAARRGERTGDKDARSDPRHSYQ
jgi:transposase